MKHKSCFITFYKFSVTGLKLITKRRDNTQRDITLATFFVCLLFLAGIWGIDVVCRLFIQFTGKNDPKPGEIYILDLRNDSEYSENSGTVPYNSEDSGIPETNFPDLSSSGNGNYKGIQIAGVSLFGNQNTIRKTAEDIHTGLLLQIDSDHPFIGNFNMLTAFENKNSYYRLKNMTLQVQDSVVDAMNELAEDYYLFSGRSDFLVYSTTEVYDVPGSLYPEILPDRASGFCLDLAFLNDDGSISPITEQNNGWLVENAWRFGFVFSYTESNRNQTGVAPAPYHLRYVGKEHAAVMYYNNKMDLHTYLSLLRSYQTENSYQYISDFMNLKISYIPASGTGTTVIPVPENGKQYSISGNNTDGFILCISDTES